MSNTPVQDPPAQGVSSGSGQTLPSRLLQQTADPSASKRVCFYKSGDYKFSGHRMVINGRTFKTFDALLDALSKKVPLPFGVRTITTPRGTHHVRALDDLQDGGSYVCSDQRRVKPLNLDEVNRRQVPWNTTRPFSAGRRKRQGPQFVRRNDFSNRPVKVTDRVAVRTPKRLVVIKNRDPTVKRTIVLQRRTAPTFDALLDYLSQILQFPVLKLYSTDGRRVDGLATLILCSGVIVAAGTEPFRLANYTFHRTGQTVQAMYMDPVEPPLLQPHAQDTKSFSSGRGSRNFSLSSERFIVDQINKSRNGSVNMHRHNGSYDTEVNQRPPSMDTCGSTMADNEPLSCIAPQDDDIEKSFRVNQDGSMTVEMKVRLTIKEEEMLHWTTTLSRSSLKRTVCASISESGNTSPDSNNAVAKESSSISEDEAKEENNSCTAGRGVGFHSEGVYEGYSPSALGNTKARYKRTPTPGPRHVKKKASVESVKTVTESGVQESTLGHYSYTERTADGETTEGYRVVRHSSSSSHRPVPKPRKTASSGASKGSHSSLRSSGVAEVLQIQNNGMEIRETVMHIYETQGSYDNYFANDDYGADGPPSHVSSAASRSRPPTDTGTGSSSNDCDIDFSSQQRQGDEMLSLSSEPVSPAHPLTNNLSVVSENDGVNSPARLKEAQSEKNSNSAGERENKEAEPAKKKGSPSTGSSEKKLKGSTMSLSKHSKRSSTDKLSSNTSVGKKSQSSSESARSGQKSKLIENAQVKRSVRDEKKVPALLLKTPPKRQNMNKAARDNGYNVNTPSGRPQMKKNMSDILQPKKTLEKGKRSSTKSKSVNENQLSSSRKSLELSETVSMPSLNPSPSEIHQYVENWLEEVTPDAVPYNEDAGADEPQPQTKVIFQIGGDSESDEKTESQTNPEECELNDTLKKSSSCLSVPLCREGPATALAQNIENNRGLCVSMPSVRVQPAPHENLLRSHKSAEAITPAAEDESTSSTSNILSPKAKIKPVLRQLCSSIHCIRTMSDTNTPSNLEKSNSLPDFSSQVASVFGSSCKAFLSFLSVMTLRDNFTGSVQSDGSGSHASSEAMLMMESLQKISTIEDEEEQRSSLTDLQSRASSQLRERWKDFQILRERLESEPLSPKFSETEFALDVVSEGGDVFEDQHAAIDELMEELNMPQDLRDEISSTIHQVKTFYPVDESTFVETERYHSETEEDIEKFVRESDTDTRRSPDPESVFEAEDGKETRQENDAGEEDENIKEQAEDGHLDKPDTVTEIDKDEAEVKEEDGQIEEAEEGEKVMNDGENEEGEVDESGGRKIEEGDEMETLGGCDEETVEGSGEESIVKEEEGTDGEMTLDEEEVRERPEEDVRETESRLTDEVEEGGSSAAETDERDCEDAEEDQKGDEENVEEDEEGGETMEEAGDVEEEEGEAGEIVEVEEEQDEEGEEAVDGDDEGEKENTVHGRADKTEGVSEEGSERDEEGEEDVGEQLEEEEEGVQLVEEEQTEHVEETEAEEEKKEEEQEEGDGDDEDEGEQEEEEGVQSAEEEEGERAQGQSEDEEEEQEEAGEVGVQSDEEEGHEEEQEDQAKEEEAGIGVEEEKEGTQEEEEGGLELEEEGVEEEEEEEAEGAQEEQEEEGEHEEEEEVEEEEGVQGEQEEEGEQEKGEEERVELEEEERGQGAENEEGEQEEEEEEGVAIEEEEGEDKEEKEEEVEFESEEEGRQEGMVKEGAEVEEEEEKADKEEEGTDLEEEEEGEKEETEEEEGEQEEMEEEDQNDQSEEEEEGGDTAVLKTIEENTDEEEEGGGTDQEVEDSERPDSDKEAKMAVIMEDESGEEKEREESGEESIGDDFDEEEDDGACEGLQEEEEQAGAASSPKHSSNCEDSKGEGTDATNGSDEQVAAVEEDEWRRRGGRSHPVEISQELLDFVNSALKASSLVFTYDDRGNIRIESDRARVGPAELAVVAQSRKETSYGTKRLPSPGTSDLSDYRPETSESGGYKTQESVDIVSGSGEELSETPFPVCRRSPRKLAHTARASTKPSAPSRSAVSKGSRVGSGGASREDLSYFSAASSPRADGELARDAARSVDLNGGVLIDRGRWLLKENHLIRKSPPVSLGMYGNLDSTSVDTGQDNTSEESPPPHKTQHGPLAAISSSELEELAKPPTPKCTYYNMLHSSDSDPFLDDSSVQSGRRGVGSTQGRGFRVAPAIDTSKTWASKNGSLSSFTSVEFKVADRKVHPEGEGSARSQARRTSSGGESSVQAQDSREALRLRCGQYCPIL